MDKVNLPEFKLVGLRLPNKTTNENGRSGIDCGRLWQKFENEEWAGKIPGQNGDEIFAVYYDYEGGHAGKFSYFIGCKVDSAAEPSKGLDSILIPEGSYTRLIAKGKMPDCISNCWKDVWNSDMERTYRYDFEVYDKRSHNWDNAEVDVFIS